MAKKKKVNRRKNNRKSNLYFELIGLAFILFAIFSSGIPMISNGVIPHVLVTLLQWLFGFWYIVISGFIFFIGIYLLIKRKWPNFKSIRWIGFYLLFASILLFTHVQTFETIVQATTQNIFGLTWDYYEAYQNGEVDYSAIGAGMTGAILFVSSFYLLSGVGSKVVATFAIVFGMIMLTEKSIIDVIKGFFSNVQARFTKMREKRAEEGEEVMALTEVENESYRLPSLQLLASPVSHSQQQEKSQIQSTVRKLEQTFQSFGVKARVSKVHVGPAVTKYEVNPDIGVKVSKIVNLHDDLALALAARDIRIEAPIPGKSAIGIEVPNSEVAQVSLREVMQPQMKPESKLLFGLGRDIAGESIASELNKMPHLLIAGATGSGKSVCVNGIITSILLRAKPHEVKMMMIDPKKVELNVYNGIPHLLAPVVTDPKKASKALKKIVSEMERRYDLFSDTATRNIEGYNEHVDKVNEEEGENHPHLPYIVVLIDELADLMMVASNEVEDAITRLAQMARAAGIHLIIATQRPSVDVITGVIKANIPSRIAFSVSSATDSRTILDGNGAEKLLGKGDMLFLPVGASKPTRIQGAFLSDEEVERVVDHCITQQKAQYQEEMIPEETSKDMEEVDDDLYDDAVQLIIEMQSASVSMLQRKFRVGYTRAARLIDAMEERGIVGPYEGSKPRKVLVSQQPEETSMQ